MMMMMRRKKNKGGRKWTEMNMKRKIIRSRERGRWRAIGEEREGEGEGRVTVTWTKLRKEEEQETKVKKKKKINKKIKDEKDKWADFYVRHSNTYQVERERKFNVSTCVCCVYWEKRRKDTGAMRVGSRALCVRMYVCVCMCVCE